MNEEIIRILDKTSTSIIEKIWKEKRPIFHSFPSIPFLPFQICYLRKWFFKKTIFPVNLLLVELQNGDRTIGSKKISRTKFLTNELVAIRF